MHARTSSAFAAGERRANAVAVARVAATASSTVRWSVDFRLDASALILREALDMTGGR
jgi:hypothetical protein